MALNVMMTRAKDDYWVATKGWPDPGGDRFAEPNLRDITEADIIGINERALRRGVSRARLEQLVLVIWDKCGGNDRLAANVYADFADGEPPTKEDA